MPRLERYADILLQYFIIRFLMSSKRFEIVGATHVGSTKKLSIQEKRVFMQNTRFFLVKKCIIIE